MRAVYQCDYCMSLLSDAGEMRIHEADCKKNMDTCQLPFSTCLDCRYHNFCERYGRHYEEMKADEGGAKYDSP